MTGYQWSKGTLQFPVDLALPFQLVRRLVDVRLEQLGIQLAPVPGANHLLRQVKVSLDM